MADLDLEGRLRSGLAELVEDVDFSDGDEGLDRIVRQVHRRQVRRRGVAATVAAIGIVLVVGLVSLWEPVAPVEIQPVAPAPATGSHVVPSPRTVPSPRAAPSEPADAVNPIPQMSVTGATYQRGAPEFQVGQRTDFLSPTSGDDSASAEGLQAPSSPPETPRLQFLWDACNQLLDADPASMPCERDAQFVDDDGRGSSSLGAGEPFHVRQGFPETGPDPLGEGFDLALYVTRSSDDLDDVETDWVLDETVHFTADSIMAGQADRCGPQYREQTEPVECTWFVHEFPDGLPYGRYEIAVVWEAPCRAWVDYGLTDDCDDPDAVQSWFSSVVDSPWDAGGTVAFDNENHAGLSPDAVMELEHGVSGEEFTRWSATIDVMMAAFNAARLEEYQTFLSDDASGLDELVEPETVAALMAASATWSSSFCWPGDGGDVTCATTISDSFHHDALSIQGDVSFTFDADGRVVEVAADRSGQSDDRPISTMLAHRHDYARALRGWLDSEHPDAARDLHDGWLPTGMPHADDMPAILQLVPGPGESLPTEIASVDVSPTGRRLRPHADLCTAEHSVDVEQGPQTVMLEFRIVVNSMPTDCDELPMVALKRPLGDRAAIDATTAKDVTLNPIPALTDPSR